MIKRIDIVSAICGGAVMLAGCGSSSLPSLSTGSLTGQQTAATSAPGTPPPDDPVGRAVQVGVTAARAQKCGYFFDAEKLRTDYLASETQRNPAPDVMQKVQNAYDYGKVRVYQKLAKQDGYCTAERTAAIKASLTRYLAGDYTVIKKKNNVAASSGSISIFDNGTTYEEKINPDWLANPNVEDKYIVTKKD